MGHVGPVVRQLDQLLGQSLAAVVKIEMSDCHVRHSLKDVLARFASHFRALQSVRVASVIEPFGTSIDSGGPALVVPKLIVQCGRESDPFGDALTLIYAPIGPTQISVQIVFRNNVRKVAGGIVWTAERGWYFPSIDAEVHAHSHVRFLTDAMLDAGLFRSSTMELVQ